MPLAFAPKTISARRALALGAVLGLLLALWVPNLLGATSLTAEAGHARWLEAAALGAIFWLLCAALLGRLWLVLALAWPVALLWPLELWLRWHNGTPISSHLVALALESNGAESANFFSAYGAGLVWLVLAWVLLYAAGCWWAWRLDVRWHHRSRVYLVIIFVPLLVLLYQSKSAHDALGSDFKVDALDDPNVSGWASQWADVYPVNVPLALLHFRQQQGKLHALQAGLASRSLQAQQAVLAHNPEVVVLVIGESASATRWGLLGYGRDTTPQLARQPGLVAFSDVVGLSVATRTAVPGVLSRRPVVWPAGQVDLEAEPSLVQAFAQVGYQTHWLSNQSPMGQHDTSISLYAREAADVRFLNPATYQHRSHLDEVLLTPLRGVLAQPGRHLVVLHLLGSHFDYSLRYPASFDHFQPSLQSAPVLPGSPRYAEQVSNSYDNSLRYTDHILAQVLNAVQQRGGNAVVAYFSDHGVDPAQGQCASQTPNRRSEAAYRVPAFVWLSEPMRAQRPAQWQQLQANAQQPYTTRALYATLLGLAQIDVAGGLPAESFLQPPAQPLPPRTVAGMGGGLVDFDVARQKSACFIVAD